MDTPHPLTAYRAKHNITPSELARHIGANRQMVWKWERGSVPSRRYCEAILKFTGGQITPSHFVLADDRRAPAKREGAAA